MNQHIFSEEVAQISVELIIVLAAVVTVILVFFTPLKEISKEIM